MDEITFRTEVLSRLDMIEKRLDFIESNTQKASHISSGLGMFILTLDKEEDNPKNKGSK